MNCSGSTSLCNALNILGIPSVHQRTKDNVDLEYLAEENIKKQNKLFYPYDLEYQGFCDFSGFRFYKNLYESYPNSKFILTLRPVDDWVRSRLKLEKDIQHEKYKKNISETVLNVFSTKLKLRYLNNLEEVRNFFSDKSSSYLELRICEGESWDKLCNFLNKEIPNTAFPYLNKSVYKI